MHEVSGMFQKELAQLHKMFVLELCMLNNCQTWVIKLEIVHMGMFFCILGRSVPVLGG